MPFFDGQSVRYIDGRQNELFLIPRPIHKTGKKEISHSN